MPPVNKYQKGEEHGKIKKAKFNVPDGWKKNSVLSCKHSINFLIQILLTVQTFNHYEISL